jgi:hypothetical protein
LHMRYDGPFQPTVCSSRTRSPAVVQPATIVSPVVTQAEPRLKPVAAESIPAIERGDTGVAFLTVYRSLLADIEQWCTPPGSPLLQVIRWHALRDYVEVYSHTYPAQPDYPFPPRFGPYVVYLEGFDTIVAAIDAWCEWLSGRFLPGVIPIDLICTTLDDWNESRQLASSAYTIALPNRSASVPEALYSPL